MVNYLGFILKFSSGMDIGTVHPTEVMNPADNGDIRIPRPWKHVELLERLVIIFHFSWA